MQEINVFKKVEKQEAPIIKQLTLAEKIINYRTEHDLSQLEFANLIKTSQNQVWRLEKGKPYRATTEQRVLNLIKKG